MTGKESADIHAWCAVIRANCYTAPLTLNPSHWYFGQSLAVAALLVGLEGYGLYRTLGTQPLFAQAILDE